jgi:hypothetical protein
VPTDTAPSFEQAFSSSLFTMPRDERDAWSAFLLVAGAKVPGEPISVRESWALEGHYLFAPAPPPLPDEAAAEQLAKAIYRWLDLAFNKSNPFPGRACVWLPESAVPPPPSQREPKTLAVTFTTATGGFLSSDLNAVVGNQLTLSVPKSTGVVPTDTTLELRGIGTRALRFVDSNGTVAGLTVAPNAATLPFTGPYTGAFVLAGGIDPGLLLDKFQAGVHFGHGQVHGQPVVQRFPILDPSGGPMPYHGAVDPIDPLNRSAAINLAEGRLRTLLAPVLAQAAENASPSYLRTARGQSVGLLPIGGGNGESGWPEAHAGALVFEDVGPAGKAAKEGDVYLTLAGDWAPVIEKAAASEALMCGLFGLERLPVRPFAPPSTHDCVRFVPSQPAFAPVFPLPPAALTEPAKEELLTTKLRTAWTATVSGDGQPTGYVAQPASSPLFTMPQLPSADAAVVLDWHGPAMALGTTPLPLAAYAGLPSSPGGFPVSELGPFESQVIAAERRRRTLPKLVARLRATPTRAAAMRAAATGASGVPQDPVTATTPQGFLARMAGAAYSHVTLARSGGTTPDFAFANPEPELQTLLQTNQLMGVVANPKYLTGFENSVELGGWTMTADIGRASTPSDARNVMLLKFCHGQLVERVANPSTWTAAEIFSTLGQPQDAALTALSAWLQAYIAEALAESDRGNTLYEDFARIVRDESWQGILVLRADVRVEDLPEQIRGLAAGIDVHTFAAHHFGTTVTPVTTAGGEIEIAGNSSLFGLIDYQLPQFRQNVAAGASPDMPLALPTDGAFGFSVLQLQALFRNAALVDFRSRVQLTAKELFGSQVIGAHSGKQASPATAVVLRGSYQRQGKDSTYIFEQDSTTVFTLDSNVLRAVAFERIQFNTLAAAEDGSGALRSRFLVWGALDFAVLHNSKGQPFDAFSFGSPADASTGALGVGLVFANLQIELSSAVATPNAATFAFDAHGLAFDLAASAPDAREQSLFKTFSLQLDSFVTPAAGKRPADLNFLPVSMDAATTTFDGAWFGVVLKVTMGTPGALVASAGFDSRMLLGWAPTTGAGEQLPAALAGLQLPGAAPGAKLMSLQGVLRVTVGSLALRRDPVAGQAGVSAFVLRLNNVGLTFLGVAKLPPGAVINFFLFGDPKGTGSLGWYAAYTKAKQRGLLELAR